ncbi:unnamed protein product [Onchocerca flexuosa]|uniref:Bulb-type lectin domain-containing protein n=1 Tax=Onchocerca flexuosa TaxID=387005 RepID=A0A183I7Q3_9BILA|nr:unnamed protein product [Onchocerca flexuosa]
MEIFFESPGCGLIKSISRPHILARRLNKIGGIVRHGTRWFQTEYSLGYNIFEYNNLTGLRFSHPVAVHSLDSQFDGTDNTACNGNTFVFYTSATSQIYSYQIDKQRSKNATISASKDRLRSLSVVQKKTVNKNSQELNDPIHVSI